MSDITLPDGWPVARTIDGVLVVPGLWVLDYNYRIGQVTAEKPDMNNGLNDTLIPWFTLTTGYFDGSRMWAYDPNSGRRITAPVSDKE
jgi:hypothetical protein